MALPDRPPPPPPRSSMGRTRRVAKFVFLFTQNCKWRRRRQQKTPDDRQTSHLDLSCSIQTRKLWINCPSCAIRIGLRCVGLCDSNLSSAFAFALLAKLNPISVSVSIAIPIPIASCGEISHNSGQLKPASWSHTMTPPTIHISFRLIELKMNNDFRPPAVWPSEPASRVVAPLFRRFVLGCCF